MTEKNKRPMTATYESVPVSEEHLRLAKTQLGNYLIEMMANPPKEKRPTPPLLRVSPSKPHDIQRCIAAELKVFKGAFLDKVLACHIVKGKGCASFLSSRRRTGVYFVLGLPAGLIKIGYSVDAGTRARAVKLPSATKIHPKNITHTQLVAYIPAGREAYYIEQYLHRLLKDRRVIGEWFRLSVEEANDIATATWKLFYSRYVSLRSRRILKRR